LQAAAFIQQWTKILLAEVIHIYRHVGIGQDKKVQGRKFHETMEWRIGEITCQRDARQKTFDFI